MWSWARGCWSRIRATILGPESGSVPRAWWFPLTDVPTAQARGWEGHSTRKMSSSSLALILGVLCGWSFLGQRQPGLPEAWLCSSCPDP